MYGKGAMCVRRLGERFAPSADTRCPLQIMGREHKYSKRSAMQHGMGSEKESIWSPVMEMIWHCTVGHCWFHVAEIVRILVQS